jgi:hypothetical protein
MNAADFRKKIALHPELQLEESCCHARHLCSVEAVLCCDTASWECNYVDQEDGHKHENNEDETCLGALL